MTVRILNMTSTRGRPKNKTLLRSWVDRNNLDAGDLAQTLGITRGTFEKLLSGVNHIHFKRAYDLEQWSIAHTPQDKINAVELTLANREKP